MKRKIYTKVISIIYVLLICQTGYSQHEANNWLLGNFGLQFIGDAVLVKHNYAPHENRGIGIISDKKGSLLFYSDGFSVWDKNHEQMPNGVDLISKKGSLIHESLLIPKPGSESIFYIFTIEPWNANQTSGVYYSVVDLNLNNGLGDVTTKGVKLLNNTSNKNTAVYHQNGKDVWFVTHLYNTNSYYSYLITETGISETPIESKVGNVITSSYDGQLKASPDGKKMACSYNEWFQFRDDFDLFDFNALTGELYNAMSFELPVTYRGADGLEFSSDATKLFVIQSGSTGESGLYQYDITADSYDEINNSRVLLSREMYNSYTRMQLAPNGKIYITKGGGGGGTEHLGVIENPNEYGENCIVHENGLYLEGGSSFVTKTPNFIQSYLFKPNFTFDNNCQATDIHFNLTNAYRLDSIQWHFGEGSSSNLLHPVFQYSKAGNYVVQMIAYYPEKTDTIIKQIIINPFTEFTLGKDSMVCKGSELAVSEKFNAYFWNTGAKTRTIKIEEESLYKVTVENSYGCHSSDSVFLSIVDLPMINLPDTIVLGNLDSIQLYPGDFNKYMWNTGDTTSSIYAKQTGWYSVYVENNYSCSSAQSIYVSSGLDPVEKDLSDWELLNPKPSYLSGRDIAFVNDQLGFFINDKQLIKTADCGNSWDIVMDITNANRIAFKNSIGYIIGSNGTIYKSTHMGAGWNKLNTNFSDHLNAISLFHQDTILITSDNKLFVSNDGGQTWDITNIDNVDIEDSYFTSPMIGHIACRNGKIFKTINGGESWYVTESKSSIPSDFFTIYFVNDSLGFATREHSDVLKTTNGGESWQAVDGYHDAYYDFCFIDDMTGFAVGEYGVIFKTINGGNTWDWAGFQNGRVGGSSLFGVNFIDENIGFAVGMRGVILKTIDGGNSWISYSPTYIDVKQLNFITDSIGYSLIGNDFFKTLDGGQNWKNIGRPNPKEQAIQFSFIDENIGYVIGGGDVGSSATVNKVYKTIDGGISWIATNDLTAYYIDDLYSICFVNENLGFVSGGYNGKGVFRTKNGGASWEIVETLSFGQIQFLDAQLGYALRVGHSLQRVYKTIDGGDTWDIAFEIEEDINSFHFIDNDNGYIIGDDRLMYKTSDGGATWQKLKIPYEYYVNVRFYSINVGYIFDEEGNLYQTQDGGANWSKLLQIYGLKNIEIENENVFISGSSGKILKGKINYNSASIHLDPIKEFTNNSAILSANVSSNGAEISDIYFEYGKNFAFNYTLKANTESVAANESQNITAVIVGLDPNTTYQCRLKIKSMGNVLISEIKHFTTLPNYEISMYYPYCQYSNQVDLLGKITSRGEAVTEVEFQYTKDTVFTGIEAVPSFVPGDTTLSISLHLTGLQAETKYFVRLKAKYNNELIYSDIYTFNTLSEYVITLHRPLINGSNATLMGAISSHKDTIRNIGFEYGTTREFSNFMECKNNTVNPGTYEQVQAELTNLNLDSIYYYRLKAEIDSSIVYSDENILSFKNEIIIVPIEVEELLDSSLILTAYVLPNGKYIRNIQFQYGTSNELSDSIPANPSFASGYQTIPVSAMLKGLTPNTKYYFKVKGIYNNGHIFSDEFYFFTNKQTETSKRFLGSEIIIYPNPAYDYININTSSKIDRVEFFNVNGRLVYSVKNKSVINIENFPHGIYLIKVYIGDRYIYKKIVK